MDRAAVQQTFDVSRETSAKLDIYADLVGAWQSRMNLVGPSTLPAIWDRHFADSLQLLALAPAGRHWLDIGTGAGFPGLVVALADPKAHVTLVESIAKKCSFLTVAAERLQIADRVTIEHRRIEAMSPRIFDVITARALAPLEKLIAWALPHTGPMTRWILPKGARVDDELVAAQRTFRFRHDLVESRTDPAGRIIVASHVTRR